MRLTLYQADAFTPRVFAGNPAAVVFFEAWPDDALLQNIALENNLAETAFLVKRGADYELRWFTPVKEIELCGHATLASAHILFTELEHGRAEVAFHTRESGVLTVRRTGDALEMDFPAARPVRVDPIPEAVQRCIDAPIVELHRARDHVAILESEAAVRGLVPNLDAISRLAGHGLIVTARGTAHDFVSRFFAPQVGVPEDPVTGSAHCALAPIWAAKLGKQELRAFQASARGGELGCRLAGDRVFLRGHAVTYLRGAIDV